MNDCTTQPLLCGKSYLLKAVSSNFAPYPSSAVFCVQNPLALRFMFLIGCVFFSFSDKLVTSSLGSTSERLSCPNFGVVSLDQRHLRTTTNHVISHFIVLLLFGFVHLLVYSSKSVAAATSHYQHYGHFTGVKQCQARSVLRRVTTRKTEYIVSSSKWPNFANRV